MALQYGKSAAQILAEMAAASETSASLKASNGAQEQASLSAYNKFALAGSVRTVQITTDDSDIVNERVGRSMMKDIGRNIGISKRVQTLYDKFLIRCITQAYRSEFHKDPQTKVGYLKNAPLVYNGTGRIGYGTGKLYKSIKMRSAGMQTSTFDEYGSKVQTFRFRGPFYNEYGKILSTGKRSTGAIPVADLILWINRKRVSGYLKNKDVNTSKKVLAFAMAIMNSYRKGRKANGSSKKREQSMKDWDKWVGNQRVQALFRKIHDAGVGRYYKMMLDDVANTYKNR